MGKHSIKMDFKDLIIMPHITWTIESQGICLMDTRSGNSSYLAYPEAALWDLLMRGYAHPEILEMLSAITSVKKERTTVFIQDCITEWLETGYLKQVHNHG